MDTESIRLWIYRFFRKKMVFKLKRSAGDPCDHVANRRSGISDRDSENIVHSVASSLNSKKGERILEIGCGTGSLAKGISKPGIQYIGMDLIFDLAKRACSRNISNAAFFQADAQRLPFPGSSFDKILFYSVILHFPPVSLWQVLAEMDRILRPGGTILIGDIPNLENADRFLTRYHANVGPDRNFSTVDLKAFLFKKKIQRILNTAGGGWYKPNDLLTILNKLGFEGKIIPQNSLLPFHHYRYDCIVCRKGGI